MSEKYSEILSHANKFFICFQIDDWDQNKENADIIEVALNVPEDIQDDHIWLADHEIITYLSSSCYLTIPIRAVKKIKYTDNTKKFACLGQNCEHIALWCFEDISYLENIIEISIETSREVNIPVVKITDTVFVVKQLKELDSKKSKLEMELFSD